eukprot:g2052.t1
MLYSIGVLATVTLATLVNANDDEHVNCPNRISKLNEQASTWTAGINTRFANATLGDVKKLCGTVMKGEEGYFELPRQTHLHVIDSSSLPESFDARTGKFASCSSVIGHIRDQSDCGSCWAFGSTEAFNDRHCIKTGDTTLMSVEDTTSCCGFLQCFSMGCNGGQPSGAWNWFKRTGVVTGGDYGDKTGESCRAYSLAPCAHHVPEYSTPKCLKKCDDNGYTKVYSQDKNKASSAYSLGSEAEIMQDIYTYGPVTGAFTVYGDFPSYKSGVYTHQSGSMLGGHAIKIMGWGVENGVKYWLVANSWNEEWGDGGTFKIKRGTNECGIESQVSAGQL